MVLRRRTVKLCCTPANQDHTWTRPTKSKQILLFSTSWLVSKRGHRLHEISVCQSIWKTHLGESGRQWCFKQTNILNIYGHSSFSNFSRLWFDVKRELNPDQLHFRLLWKVKPASFLLPSDSKKIYVFGHFSTRNSISLRTRSKHTACLSFPRVRLRIWTGRTRKTIQVFFTAPLSTEQRVGIFFFHSPNWRDPNRKYIPHDLSESLAKKA